MQFAKWPWIRYSHFLMREQCVPSKRTSYQQQRCRSVSAFAYQRAFAKVRHRVCKSISDNFRL